MLQSVQVQPTNGQSIAVVEMVVVGANALGKIHLIAALVASTMPGGSLIVPKDTTLLQIIGLLRVLENFNKNFCH